MAPFYPTAIPTEEQIFNYVDDVDWMNEAKWDVMRGEIVKIAAELGTLPKGAYATVKARLDAGGAKIQDADGDTKVDTEESSDEDQIRMDVKGVEAFLLQDDGILDLVKQSTCRAYRNASAQVLPSGVEAKIEFDAENWDIQNEFDSAVNYRFTAKKAGKYVVVVGTCLLSMPDGAQYWVSLKKNGAKVTDGEFTIGAASNPRDRITDIVNLAVNDFLEAYVTQQTGANKNLHNTSDNTFISIHKLS